MDNQQDFLPTDLLRKNMQQSLQTLPGIEMHRNWFMTKFQVLFSKPFLFHYLKKRKPIGLSFDSLYYGSIISVVGKSTVEIMEPFLV